MEVSIEKICAAYGMKITEQRRSILRVIEESTDHPDVEELYRRANKLDEKISLATVYRTIAALLEYGLLSKLELEDGRARYELIHGDSEHHDHLIDLNSGKIIEFYDEALEAIQEDIAKRLGYKLIRHRMELYGVPLEGE